MPSSTKNPPDCFIEFEVHDGERFGQLQVVFSALQQAKRSGTFPEADYWLRLFDESARAYFWWPTEDELDEWLRRWNAAPLPQRASDPSLKTGWDFESMIEGFRSGEFDLLDCRFVSGSRARMEFEVYGW